MHRTNILVVDNDPEILSGYRRMLPRDRYWVLTAENGPEALQMLEKKKVHAVVSDIRMPGMDGIELLGRIKERYRNIGVIMVSEAYYDTEELKMLGALQLLPKPVPDSLLVSLLDMVTGEERRKTHRFGMELRFKTDKTRKGHVLNISSDGMLVETGDPLPRGGNLSFSLTNPYSSRSFDVGGMVLHTTNIHGSWQSAVYFERNIGQTLSACMGNESSPSYA